MQPIHVPITGKEEQLELTQTFQALVQFYCAFNNGDMDLMANNWEQSEYIAMDNPLGGIKRGWNEIKLVIRTSRIFKRVERVWKQVHHHGSIDNPKLLEQYQSAVLGNK